MEVAQRLQRIPPYPFLELARLKDDALARGVDLIDFGIGDPDMPTPGHIVEALAEAARDPATHVYDESGYGTIDFRRSVAHFMQARFGAEVDPYKEIQSTLGAKEALAHIVWAYCDPGDIVLVPDPAYAVYRNNAIFCSGVPYGMPLRAENGFLPDLSAIPLSVVRAAKLIFVNYPNNPTGAVAELDFYETLVRFAQDWDLIICQDCAYSEVYYEGYRPHSILEVAGAKHVAIEFHSLSKTFNMTGWRIGWAAGGERIVAALSKLKSYVDSNLFMAVQRAASAGLDQFEEFAEERRQAYEVRRDATVDGLNALGWELDKPKATFYIWAPVPSAHTAESFTKALLTECGILATPGLAYGDHGEGYFRLSLTLNHPDPVARIEEAMQRIGDKLGANLWEG